MTEIVGQKFVGGSSADRARGGLSRDWVIYTDILCDAGSRNVGHFTTCNKLSRNEAFL